MQTLPDSKTVAPVLEKYAEGPIESLWKREELSKRDRSIVTITVLIVRNLTTEMTASFNVALDNGVKPREISEIITHLAFYAGWSNAASAVSIAKEVFAQRNIGADQLPAISPELLPLDIHSEEKRAAFVEQLYGKISPGLVQFTTDVLFHDLWLRPDLEPRDRSLITVTMLITSGHVRELAFHLNKGMDNGLTPEEAGEIITHLAFYAGWPNAFSAVGVVKEVVEKRSL